MTPWTVAHQASLSMGFPRQGTLVWVGHFLLQGIFPTQGWNPSLLRSQANSFTAEPQAKPGKCLGMSLKLQRGKSKYLVMGCFSLKEPPTKQLETGEMVNSALIRKFPVLTCSGQGLFLADSSCLSSNPVVSSVFLFFLNMYQDCVLSFFCISFCCQNLATTVFLLLFSYSPMSDSLQPHGLQHARLPCPSYLSGFAQIHAH